MKVTRNIMINKVGGSTASKNAVNYRVSLPVDMIRALGVTKEDRTVTLELFTDKIEIKKFKEEEF
jgi:hypothetical protein